MRSSAGNELQFVLMLCAMLDKMGIEFFVSFDEDRNAQ